MSLKLRCQQGFTTVTLMGVLAVGGLLVAAGFAAVDGDIGLTREDQDYKQSYGAAEGGLQWYLNRMGQDNNFYVRCANVPAPNATEFAPVNLKWSGSGADPRVWRKLPGEQAEYTVELMPAPGFSNCIQNNQYSMVDPNGNLTLRVTGRSRGEYRTVLATLRRANFIDFIYFTDFETLDPAAYVDQDDTDRAAVECARYRALRTSFCTEIQFTATDVINGPFHTNDNLRICGNATFGRNTRDLIEISGDPSWVNGGCTASPNIVGTLVPRATPLDLPPSNAALETVVLPGYKFQGRTRIQLNGTTMSVTTGYTTANPSGTTTTMALPSNGVIYVDNSLTGSCSGGYVREQRYSGLGAGSPSSCGNAWVSGTYNSDLTIGADNDVIVENDLIRGNDGVLLGLIANNFVRVYHPVDHDLNEVRRLRQHGKHRGPADRRGHPGPAALVHPRQLVLRRADGRPDGVRGHRPAVPRAGRHRFRGEHLHRLPQGVRVQRPPALPRAALFPRSRAGLLADLARDRAGAGDQALTVASGDQEIDQLAGHELGPAHRSTVSVALERVHAHVGQRRRICLGGVTRPLGALRAEQHQAAGAQ